MVVLSGTVDNDVRLIVAKNRQDELLNGEQQLSVTAPWRQRQVESIGKGSRAAQLGQVPAPRKQRSSVLVNGDMKDLRVVVVYILCSICVVGVSINDGYAQLAACSLSQVFNEYSLVVYRTEAPRTMDNPHGMVAWGSQQGKRPVYFT